MMSQLQIFIFQKAQKNQFFYFTFPLFKNFQLKKNTAQRTHSSIHTNSTYAEFLHYSTSIFFTFHTHPFLLSFHLAFLHALLSIYLLYTVRQKLYKTTGTNYTFHFEKCVYINIREVSNCVKYYAVTIIRYKV